MHHYSNENVDWLTSTHQSVNHGKDVVHTPSKEHRQFASVPSCETNIIFQDIEDFILLW